MVPPSAPRGTEPEGRCCLLGGWRLVVDAVIPTVAPCPVHRADQHARWAAGEYQPRRPVYGPSRAHLAVVQ